MLQITCGEAIRNLKADRTRSFATTIVFSILCLMVAFFELQELASIDSTFQEAINRGSFVAVISPGEDEHGLEIAGFDCESLRTWRSVQAVGALRKASAMSFKRKPGINFFSAQVSTGMLALLKSGPIEPTRSLWYGTAASEELGVKAGGYLNIDGIGPVKVAGVYDSERSEQLHRWALVIHPTNSMFEECWVEFDPVNYELGSAAALVSVAGQHSSKYKASPLGGDGELNRLLDRFKNRPQRFVWIPTAAIGCVFITFNLWTRRGEWALYRAIGFSKIQLFLMAQVETILCCALGWIIGFAAAWLLAMLAAPEVHGSHLVISSRSSLAAVAIPIVFVPANIRLLFRTSLAELVKGK